MTVTRTRRRRWPVTGIVIVAIAAALGIVWVMVPGFPLGLFNGKAEYSYAFDVSDPAQLVAWADDVFLGRVIEQSGGGFYPDSNPDKSSDLPYALYRVEVLESLKGKLSGVIEITQPGGIASEDDRWLTSGETCLFITSGEYDPSAGPDELQMLVGRPAVVNGYGDIRVRSEAERSKVLDKYRTAVAEQVKPEL